MHVYNVDKSLQEFEAYSGELFPGIDIVELDSSTFKSRKYNFLPGKRIAVVHCYFILCKALNLSAFDLVIVMSKEWIHFHNYEGLLKEHFSNNNIIFITGDSAHSTKSWFDDTGNENNFDFTNHFSVPWMLMEVVPTPYTFKQYDYSIPRLKKFDALLGGVRAHRQFVFDKIKSTGLLDNFFVNLTKCITWEKIYRSPELSKYEPSNMKDLIKDASAFNSYLISYNKFKGRASNIVPWDIYRQSNYSIVAETIESDFYYFKGQFFPTEKTAKPLFAKRLFIVFSTPRFLQGLHRLGFRTFDGIIDESYDLIDDDQDRWQAAWDQVQYLIDRPATDIYNKITAILEHNHQHIKNREFFISPLRTFLINKINQLN